LPRGGAKRRYGNVFAPSASALKKTRYSTQDREVLVRRYLLAATLSAVLVGILPAGALAGGGNPSGTGPPSQNCQEIEEAGGSPPSQQATKSPGSPFNEAGFNSEEGGIGGQNYNEKSQYDVACYHVSQH
jgi:hypothetical protein